MYLCGVDYTWFKGSSSYSLTCVIFQKRWESLERPGLSRAHSLRMYGSSYGEEGLKRVCSAPQLGDQEKGSLLKRKLSVSDTEPCVVDSGSSKHKKQGQLFSLSLNCSPLCLVNHIIISKFRCHDNVSHHIIVVMGHNKKLNTHVLLCISYSVILTHVHSVWLDAAYLCI